MLGLLVKDFRLLANQKQFFYSILFISIFLIVSGQGVSSAVSYCTMVVIFFIISTISYDEYNNGYAFLFTLPVTRRQYAVEKYLFTLLTGGMTWLVTTVAGYFYGRMRENLVASEWFAESAGSLFALSIVVCFMIPVQLKYGAEKSRIALIVFIFASAAVVIMLQKGFRAMEISVPWMDSFVHMNAIGTILLCGIGFVFVVTASLLISIRVVEKKQF